MWGVVKFILMCPFEGVWKEYVIEQKLTGGGNLYMCRNNTIFVHTEEKKGTLPRAES